MKCAACIPAIKRHTISFAVVLLCVCARAQDAYKPPAESAGVVSEIHFAGARSIGERFRERFNSCDKDNICLCEPQTCSTDRSRNRALLKLSGGTIFFEAKMAIDTDGSRLSRILYEERKKAGKKVIDQPDTSLRYSDGKSLDADTVPYIAVPGGGFRHALGVDKGDIVAVVYEDVVSYAIVGDVGPACKIGEGSLRLHEQLGHKACLARDSAGVCTRATNHSIETGVLYFIFPGSRQRIVPGLTPGNINGRIESLGPELLKTLKVP